MFIFSPHRFGAPAPTAPSVDYSTTLDLTGVQAIWSMIPRVSSYTGPFVQLYNGVTTGDFRNELTAISDFIAAGDGTRHIYKWYDHSGNGHHLDQVGATINGSCVPPEISYEANEHMLGTGLMALRMGYAGPSPIKGTFNSSNALISLNMVMRTAVGTWAVFYAGNTGEADGMRAQGDGEISTYGAFMSDYSMYGTENTLKFQIRGRQGLSFTGKRATNKLYTYTILGMNPANTARYLRGYMTEVVVFDASHLNTLAEYQEDLFNGFAHQGEDLYAVWPLDEASGNRVSYRPSGGSAVSFACTSGDYSTQEGPSGPGSTALRLVTDGTHGMSHTITPKSVDVLNDGMALGFWFRNNSADVVRDRTMVYIGSSSQYIAVDYRNAGTLQIRLVTSTLTRSLYIFAAHLDSVSTFAGQWNHIYVILKGGYIGFSVNGETIPIVSDMAISGTIAVERAGLGIDPFTNTGAEMDIALSRVSIYLAPVSTQTMIREWNQGIPKAISEYDLVRT